MAEKQPPRPPSLATNTLLPQSLVSKRIKLLHNPLDPSNRPQHPDFDQPIISPPSSPPSRLSPRSLPSSRLPRLTSHGLTPDLLPFLREKSPAHAVQPVQSEQSRDGPPIEWQKLPCLKEVIPSEVRESVFGAAEDGKPAIEIDSGPNFRAVPRERHSSARFSSGAADITCSNDDRVYVSEGHGTDIITHVREDSGKLELKTSCAGKNPLSWKSRRGKFAANTPTQSNNADYPWMSFLSIQLMEPRREIGGVVFERETSEE